MPKYKAILFDMDGTLVPMDMKKFISGYFHALCKKLAPYKVEPDRIVDAVWKGVASMVKSDGSRTNAENFWDTFYTCIPEVDNSVEASCLDFYSNEFNDIKSLTLPNPHAREIVELARSKAEYVVLATNPQFPMVGQLTRLSWVDLKSDDFDLVTSYETDNFCKPNPLYFDSICKRLNVKPSECLMVGNDEDEDMYAASSIGMDCFLVTDTMIPSKEHPWNGACGSMEELINMLREL